MLYLYTCKVIRLFIIVNADGTFSILLVRKSIDDKCFVKVITVQFTVFVGNQTKREIICFTVMQRCPICKPCIPKASFHWICLAKRTLRKFVVVWLGTGGISRNMHVLLHIKAILENFTRKRFVGMFYFM